MKSIFVREAGLEDLDVLTDLFEAYRVWYQKEPNRAAARDFLRERIERSESVIYLAIADDKVVGFTQLYPLFSSTRMKRVWLLNDLFVQDSYRGKGISRLLLERAKELARQTGACEIMLETAKTNTVGNQLYPSAGFALGNDFNWYHWNS